MGRTVSIKFKTEQNTLDAMQQVLDAVNRAQRKMFKNLADEQGLTVPEFLFAHNENENWTNGVRVHSTDFINFTLLFRMNGSEKCVRVNDCGYVSASMGLTEENDDFMNKVMDELQNIASETLRLYHEDECQRTIHSKTVSA